MCFIGDPKVMEIRVIIEQADAEFISVGDSVELKFDNLPGKTFEGRVAAISREDVTEASRRLSSKSGGDLATKSSSSGGERPQLPSLFVRVQIDNSERLLMPGIRGRAKIHARPRTLGDRLSKYVLRMLHFR